MATKKKKDNALRKEFLVRLLDQDSAELIEKALNKNIYPNRNKLVNECIKGWLSRVIAHANPEATLSELFAKEMTDFTRKIYRKLDEIKKLLLIISTIQNYDDKAIGYLISQLDYILSKQEAIPALPDEAIQLGNYDKLPRRLENSKERALADLLGDSTIV